MLEQRSWIDSSRLVSKLDEPGRPKTLLLEDASGPISEFEPEEIAGFERIVYGWWDISLANEYLPTGLYSIAAGLWDIR